MMDISQTMQTLWHFILGTGNDTGENYFTNNYNDTINTPLLSRQDIKELRQRALRIIATQTKNKKVVLYQQHGEQASPRIGYGLDYEESRVFQPGDELRFMNWRLTARTNKPHVKIFREEQQAGVCILIDCRNNMQFGTRTRLKITQALRAFTFLAFYHHYLDRSLTSMVLKEDCRWHGTVYDELGVLAMIDSVNQAYPPSETPLQKQASLKYALSTSQSVLSTGSHIFLISDFSDITTEYQPILAQLANEHEVTAIHIVDSAERKLPSAGNINLVQMSSGKTITIDSSDKKISRQYQQASQQYLDERETLLNGIGVHYKLIDTTIDNVESFILEHL